MVPCYRLGRYAVGESCCRTLPIRIAGKWRRAIAVSYMSARSTDTDPGGGPVDFPVAGPTSRAACGRLGYRGNGCGRRLRGAVAGPHHRPVGAGEPLVGRGSGPMNSMLGWYWRLSR